MRPEERRVPRQIRARGRYVLLPVRIVSGVLSPYQRFAGRFTSRFRGRVVITQTRTHTYTLQAENQPTPQIHLNAGLLSVPVHPPQDNPPSPAELSVFLGGSSLFPEEPQNPQEPLPDLGQQLEEFINRFLQDGDDDRLSIASEASTVRIDPNDPILPDYIYDELDRLNNILPAEE